MAKYANHSWHNIQFMVGDFVWLLLKHLFLPNPLTHKLAAKFVEHMNSLNLLTLLLII